MYSDMRRCCHAVKLFFPALACMLIFGCRQDRGRGKYIISGIGDSPGTDAVYIVDTTTQKETSLCGSDTVRPLRCNAASLSADRSVWALLKTPVAGEPSAIIIRKGQVVGSFPTLGCEVCQASSLYVSPDANTSILIADNPLTRASSAWLFTVADSTWRRITEWVNRPDWLIRPMMDERSKVATFLRVRLSDRGLIGTLIQMDISSSSQKEAYSGLNIGSYALGPGQKMLLWSKDGLSYDPGDGKLLLIRSPKTILKTGETLRPDGISFSKAADIGAIAVINQKTGLARIIEINLKTKAMSSVFQQRLGTGVALQAINM